MRVKAFTLVELLVVVAIIALLLGILLPAMNKARESARNIKCASAIHQMQLAAEIYSQACNAYFPPAYGEPFGSTSWELSAAAAGKYVPGTLWLGQGDVKIQQCPSYKGPDNWSNAPYSGYNYNTSFIGHGSYEANTQPARASQILYPATTAIFGDGGYAGGANKFMRSPVADPTHFGDNVDDATRAAGTQAFRHLDATNVGYVDGHTQSLSSRFTAGQTAISPATGFLSDTNDAYDLN